MNEEKDTIIYKSNSHKSHEAESKQPERKVEKVVTNEVKERKKGFFGKIKSMFGCSDDTKSVGTYIISDVLIPSAKKAISDAITTGIDMLLYGESRHSRSNSSGSKISYQRYFDDRNSSSRYKDTRSSTVYGVKDWFLQSRAEADRVLETLDELLSKYGRVTVNDYYDTIGVDSVWTDEYWGWNNISDARIRYERDGWIIIMPRPIKF